tara:strand:- start:281 stop:469 length:189 start_codon:yes stop_codon:yes gene_type:complete
MKHPEMKPYEFTITGTVYAGSESHAMHFVYWATHDGGIDNYRDASAASISNVMQTVKEREEK